MTQSYTVTILEEAILWIDSGQQVALATVVETWGSSPFQIGSKMIVNEKGNFLKKHPRLILKIEPQTPSKWTGITGTSDFWAKRMGPRIKGRTNPVREIPPSAKTQRGSPSFSLFTDSLILLRDFSGDTVKV